MAGDEGGGGGGGPELAEMEKVVVAVVWEAELEDLLTDVVGERARGGGRELVGGSGGGEGRVFLVVAETGDGVGVVVHADEDAVIGVGGIVAGEEAEGREVAALAAAGCCFSCHGGGGGGRGWG